jgi:NADPH:quinone reductase-like Zn-dependent oxidoreductase
MPGYMSYEDAATLPCAAVTAWQDLVTVGHMKAGDTILVMGTGGVSIFALQFAKAAGAQVIITSSSDAKLERAKQLGADHLINYKTTPAWGKAVLDITNGVGVDHVVEVGGAGTLEQSFQAVRAGGFIGLIGVLTGFAGQVNPMPVLQKSIHLQGIYVGSRDMFDDMNTAMEINQIKPVIDKVYPFEQAQDALRCMEAATHFGKIVVTG